MATSLQIKPLKKSKLYREPKVSLKRSLLPEKTDKNQDITNRIKTFENACAELNINSSSVKIVGLDDDTISSLAYIKLVIIARALNEGWKPNWEDSNEKKWYPYFMLRGGFRFIDSTYDCDHSNTDVGARLCFKTEALAIYAGRQFANEYREYMLIEK